MLIVDLTNKTMLIRQRKTKVKSNGKSKQGITNWEAKKDKLVYYTHSMLIEMNDKHKTRIKQQK